jgi:hypothetical protein
LDKVKEEFFEKDGVSFETLVGNNLKSVLREKIDLSASNLLGKEL